MTETWDKNDSLVNNIKAFQHSASEWNRNIFGHIGVRKRKLLARIVGLQKRLEERPTMYHLELEQELNLEYEDICLQEELL